MSVLGSKQEEVLRFIDRFGVITSSQLIAFMKGHISHVSIYNTKKKLVSLGFIGEEKIGYDLILFIKPRGVHYLNSQLTPFTKVNYGLLKHQLLMNDCLLVFKSLAEKREKNFDFLTERQLRATYLDSNFTQADRQNSTKLKQVPERIPDFVLVEDGGRIAHEVELTQKSSKRYTEKMKRYRDELLNGEYKMIRYLCDDEKIKEVVSTFAAREGFDKSTFQVELVGRLLAIGKK